MNLKELCDRVDRMEDRQTNLEQALLQLATKKDVQSTIRWPLVIAGLMWAVNLLVTNCGGVPVHMPIPAANAQEAK